MHRDDRRRLLRRLRDGAPPDAAATPAATATPTPTPTPTPTSTPAPSSLTASTLGSLRRATTGRTRTSGASHLGAGLVEIQPVPFRDPARGRAEAAAGRAREPPLLRATAASRSDAAATGRPGARRGSAANAGRRSRSSPSSRPATSSPASTRSSAASPTAAWAGSTSPGTATCPTAGSCSRGCSTRATTTRWPPRSPSAGSWPRSSTRTSSRSSTSSSTRAPATSSWSTSAAAASSRSSPRAARPTAASPTRCRRRRRSPTCSRSCRRSATCTEHGLLFCDFKIDNVIQTQHSLKLIDLGGVYRMDDPSASVFGTVGYQAPEIASSGPVDRVGPVHGRAHARGAVLRLPRLPEQLPLHPSAAGHGPAARALRLAVPAPVDGHRARPGRPLPVGRGDGRPALRRPARGRQRRRRAHGAGAEQAVHRPGARRQRARPTGACCRVRWSPATTRPPATSRRSPRPTRSR